MCDGNFEDEVPTTRVQSKQDARRLYWELSPVNETLLRKSISDSAPHIEKISKRERDKQVELLDAIKSKRLHRPVAGALPMEVLEDNKKHNERMDHLLRETRFPLEKLQLRPDHPNLPDKYAPAQYDSERLVRMYTDSCAEYEAINPTPDSE